MEALLTSEATKLIREGNLRGALIKYELLKKQTGLNVWDYNINRLNKMIFDSPSPGDSLRDALSNGLGIQHAYVVNLTRRPDRKLRMLRELTKQGITAEFIAAEDAAYSREVMNLHAQYMSRPVSTTNVSSRHIPLEAQERHKQTLSAGVFGYLLSQRNVINDAKKRGFKRILVLDDDVFFSTNSVGRIKQVAEVIRDSWKILLLGASEYSDRTSQEFLSARCKDYNKIYHPIPGNTCGSFAVAYDESIFDDLLNAIEEFDGTYDNASLGYIYAKYRSECFVVDPAVCIPDVSDSDIRDDSRTQIDHGKKMNWEFNRFEEFISPIVVSILITSFDSVRYIERFQVNTGKDVIVNIYYVSSDGIRPIIPGHIFRPVDDMPENVLVTNGNELRDYSDANGVPFSNIIIKWPPDIELTKTSIINACIEIFKKSSGSYSVSERDGDLIYCMEAGVKGVTGLNSIIIPVFRSVEQVWPSLKSVLSQENSNIEVIIVSDNPCNVGFCQEITNKINQYMDDLPSKRSDVTFRVIEHHKNRNASAARNTGFYKSRGEFISFLDDDDLYDSTRIEVTERVLSTAPNQIGACYCGYSGNWNGYKDDRRFPEGNLLGRVLSLKYAEHYMCTNTVTYKRRHFSELGGFNEAYWRHQDLELSVRFFERFEIAAVKEFCVKNRPAPVSETFNADIGSLCALKRQFLSDFRDQIRGGGDDFVSDVLAAHSRDILKRCVQKSDESAAIINAFLVSIIR